MSAHEASHRQQDADGVALQPARDHFAVQKQGEPEEHGYILSASSIEQSSYADQRTDEEPANDDRGPTDHRSYDGNEADPRPTAERSCVDSTQENSRHESEMYDSIRSELEHLSQMQVHPEVGMKVAKSRMLLQKSGILEEVTQMRQVLEKKNGVRLGMSLRTYHTIPSVHANVAYHLPRPTGANRIEKVDMPSRPAQRPRGAINRGRGRPASALPSSRPPVAETRTEQQAQRPGQRKKHKRPESHSKGSGIRALTRDIINRPISAPPQLREPLPMGSRYGAVQPHIDVVLSSIYDDLDADTKDAFKDSIRPGRSAPGRSFRVSLPPPASTDLSDWLFNGTIEDLFGKPSDASNPRKRLHDAAVKRAAEKMVKEGKAFSVQNAMLKMKEDWYSRTGEWKHYAWSAFGAEHKSWASKPWFAKETKEITVAHFASPAPITAFDTAVQAMVGGYAEPPMDSELANLVKTMNPVMTENGDA